MKRNILMVGAHGDDIEIGCSGSLIEHKKKGDKIILLVVALPSYTNYNGKILRSLKDGEIEERESAKLLGVAKSFNLGFKTKKIQYNYKLIEAINKIIDDEKIDIIYTHWIHDTHQDHVNTTKSVLAAGRYVSTILMYEPFYPAGRSYQAFHPQLYIDISKSINKKIAAMKCHKSQMLKYGSKKIIDAIKGRAKHRGYEINTLYAECFEIIRMSNWI